MNASDDCGALKNFTLASEILSKHPKFIPYPDFTLVKPDSDVSSSDAKSEAHAGNSDDHDTKQERLMGRLKAKDVLWKKDTDMRKAQLQE